MNREGLQKVAETTQVQPKSRPKAAGEMNREWLRTPAGTGAAQATTHTEAVGEAATNRKRPSSMAKNWKKQLKS